MHIELTNDNIDERHIREYLKDEQAGSILIFHGTTRKDSSDTSYITQLSYECHEEMAKQQLKDIAVRAKEQYNLINVYIVHRLAHVSLTESSIILGVSSGHRIDSLRAVEYIMNEIKKNVTIWKKDHYADQTTDWNTHATLTDK